MISAWWLLLVPVAGAIGAGAVLFVMARDEFLVRIEPDQMIVKKPAEGLILVALTKEMARRVIMKKENSSGHTEARDLYLSNN